MKPAELAESHAVAMSETRVLTAERERESVRRVVAGVIQRKDGQGFVSQRRKRTPLEGVWEFPGGKVEPGESDSRALARELLEELGVKNAWTDGTAICELTSESWHVVVYYVKCGNISSLVTGVGAEGQAVRSDVRSNGRIRRVYLRRGLSARRKPRGVKNRLTPGLRTRPQINTKVDP